MSYGGSRRLRSSFSVAQRLDDSPTVAATASLIPTGMGPVAFSSGYGLEMHEKERPQEPKDDPGEAPEIPTDEPKPAPVQDPPAEPNRAPYVVRGVNGGATHQRESSHE